jgi:hypothetical protein
VHLEASTKPHVHKKIEIFWTNIASTMAFPNFKNRPKNGIRPLGIKEHSKKMKKDYETLYKFNDDMVKQNEDLDALLLIKEEELFAQEELNTRLKEENNTLLGLLDNLK